jgi:hypothetical protein
MSELQPQPTTVNPYNQFIPAITREIALLARPHPFFYVVHREEEHDGMWIWMVEAFFTSFAEASRFLLESTDGYSKMKMKYDEHTTEWSCRIHPQSRMDHPEYHIHPLCICQDNRFISVEWMNSLCEGYDKLEVFIWRMYAGRFYNNTNHDSFAFHTHWGLGIEIKRRLGIEQHWCSQEASLSPLDRRVRMCFLSHLHNEGEVARVRPLISETEKLMCWQSLQQHPPQITRDHRDLTDDKRLVLEQTIQEAEVVNESPMLQSYRRAVRKYLGCQDE